MYTLNWTSNTVSILNFPFFLKVNKVICLKYFLLTAIIIGCGLFVYPQPSFMAIDHQIFGKQSIFMVLDHQNKVKTVDKKLFLENTQTPAKNRQSQLLLSSLNCS